ncbi:TDP-N-acetylfucosamine:lipid II N-acetylfucosaminyltransferase [Winogradskyella sp.]|uniref:TDP-N-acetylfucosamine:lipid II N-acetylfucosaminyltransferase n=1 Tax=Winogradskyella sp. TaxID=1883156 RepID=UPI0025D6F57F|nr:TDP-N-acetylfucosamine:lipid II N-acetylfucosaminyltransferase [Winogradskyella sp.]
MVLHFVTDEKVTDQIIENFSKVDKSCFFLVFELSHCETYKYITSSSDRLIKFQILNDDINDIIKKHNVTTILTHAFHLEYAKAILKISKSLKIAWYTWGFDVYGLPKIKPLTYAPLTNKYLLQTTPKLRIGRVILKYGVLRKLYFLFTKEEDRYSMIYRALKRVDYFVTYLEEDYKYFSNQYSNSFNYINCPFSTIDQYLAGNNDLHIANNAVNILIGNSNSEESNHLDALEHIFKQKEGYDDLSIYVPLSYGGNINYRECIIKEGEELFGDSFVPLLEFMNRKDYIEVLRSCSVGVFYHYRQQAMGNIIAMLYLGSRVYLSKKNPAYAFFVDNNISVFDLDKDYSTYKNSKLNEKQILHNRTMLNTIFNEDRVLKEITKLNTKIH